MSQLLRKTIHTLTNKYLALVDLEIFRKLALSFPDTEEQPHFDNPSFRVSKKIFATYWIKDNRAMVKLSLIDQSVFCAYDKTIFFPVPGGWGRQGATFVELKKVRKDMFKDALTSSYNFIANRKRIKPIKKKNNKL